MVVLDDADLDAAVDAAAFGAFMNQGQICMSTERLVVDESIADAFVAKLAAKAAPAAGRRSDQGRCRARLGGRHAEAIQRIAALVEDAKAKGATVAAGGDAQGTIMHATVIDHVDAVDAPLRRGVLRSGGDR